jgi:hypothetical protein
MLDENVAKEILLSACKKQIDEIRIASRDMREALKTKDEDQIKFVISAVRLLHDYLFTHVPRLAAKAVVENKYRH